MWNIHVEYAVFGNSVLSMPNDKNTGKLMKWGAIFFFWSYLFREE